MFFSGPYSQAVRSNGVLFTAGEIGMGPGTLDLAPGGAPSEAALAMRSLKRVLDVYRCRDVTRGGMAVCYTTSLGFREVVVNVWKSQLGIGGALAVPVVSGLPKGAKVEWHLILATKVTEKLAAAAFHVKIVMMHVA